MKILTKKIGQYSIDLKGYEIPGNKQIYVFDMAQNFKFSMECSRFLLKLIITKGWYDVDAIVCAESKGVILGTLLAASLNKDLVVFRKENKKYYDDMVSVITSTYTTENPKRLYCPDHTLESLKYKRVLFVDDVISTGSTYKAISSVLESYGVSLVGSAYVFSEGTDMRDESVVYLDTLPIENI